MGRKNSGKKKHQQKKQKKGRKSSKGYPGIPQEQVTCREVAIYVPPDECDQESDYDSDDDLKFYDCGCRREDHDSGFSYDFGTREMLHQIFMAMVLSEIAEQRMTGNRGGPSFGFSNRRARR